MTRSSDSQEAAAGADLRRGRFARLARDLSGGTDRVLVGLVVDQLGSAERGVALARELVSGVVEPAEARSRMAEVEHDGDAHRAVLVGSMRRSVTSPIDREDLYRLSRSVDDVLDSLRDFVREFDLFGAVPDPVYDAVLRALADGLDRLRAAVRLLASSPRAAAEAALAAKKHGTRPIYQQAVSEVLASGAPSAALLRSALLLVRLDVAGERLAAAADALADGVVKRFQ